VSVLVTESGSTPDCHNKEKNIMATLINTQEIVSGNNRTLLAPFGSRAELTEYANRLEITYRIKIKGGEVRRLTKPESIRFASACLAHGLDPNVGQIWATEGKDGEMIIKIGRNGWTLAVATQLKNEGGGNAWTEYRQILDEAERVQLLVPKGAVAFECKLFDTPSIRAYSEAVERLSKAGASWPEIKEALGSRPYSVGIGIYLPSDKTKYQDESYPPVERTKKRAYEAAIKYRFALPFDEIEGAEELPAQYTGPMLGAPKQAAAEAIIDGDSKKRNEGDYQPDPAAIDAALKVKQERDTKALYGEG
jgi:hypothetical protein